MTGRLLDAGCGMQRYRHFFDCTEYIGLEYNDKFKPDYVGDVRAMPFDDASFDSVLSNQVLEHVDDTHRVVSELHRVLRPGGYACITVPFVGRLHERPHDYWRFSEYGLRYLFERHGFEEITITPMKGLLTTQAALWHYFIWESLQRYRITRLLRAFIMPITNLLVLAAHAIDWDRTLPINYFAIARKPLTAKDGSTISNSPADSSE